MLLVRVIPLATADVDFVLSKWGMSNYASSSAVP